MRAAEVRPHIDARAYRAARFEKASVHQSALEMQSMSDDGMTTREIAEQVTAAGFPIGHVAVSNRLKALFSVLNSPKPTNEGSQEDAFGEAYKAVNNPKKKRKLAAVPDIKVKRPAGESMDSHEILVLLSRAASELEIVANHAEYTPLQGNDAEFQTTYRQHAQAQLDRLAALEKRMK